ncbi:cytochrome-c peroxidase [Burkholderia glumae]|uniref:cytochrome-c peroxidase n=1 Tax=Burkholderia glumae TaxID=337 RepID=UPI000C27DB52|nr:cytochrome c peroxidase [Burkholderia glumae]PJO22387.1 cytochrome-c peroxidase [Burkholderia glumae AU6208]QHE09430.1 cytochrome-c peroxidase [Burkholderia glumae AU6208]
MRPHDVLRRARRPARAPRRLTAAAAAALACAALAASGWPGAADTAAAGTSDAPDGWRADERALLASLRLSPERPASVDPSNRVAASADAARLGKRLFADPRLSRNGAVACASCHLPGDQFQDGRPLALGIATGARRTMPVVGATDAPWLFWDGRKDSLWSQAVGPIENPSEHGATRLRAVHVLAEHYRADYARLFGALPDVSRLPRDAGPLGTGTEQAAWRALDEPTRAGVSRAFANLGKAIAAYEATLQYAPSRFDSYLDGVSSGNAAQLAALTPVEKAGLRLFIGKAQCVSCHTGPMLSDRQFHNIGVPPRGAAAADAGRAAAIGQVLADEFNCLGPFSDAQPAQCEELQFISNDDPQLLGAFKTPTLRNVAARAPYMHAGQFASLDAAVRHYADPPPAAIGRSELKRIALSDAEQRQLIALLGALSGSIVERPLAR